MRAAGHARPAPLSFGNVATSPRGRLYPASGRCHVKRTAKKRAKRSSRGYTIKLRNRPAVRLAKLWDRYPATMLEGLAEIWEELLRHIPEHPPEYKQNRTVRPADVIGTMIPLLSMLSRSELLAVQTAIQYAVLDDTFAEFRSRGGNERALQMIEPTMV